jgi:hypothetical protein
MPWIVSGSVGGEPPPGGGVMVLLPPPHAAMRHNIAARPAVLANPPAHPLCDVRKETPLYMSTTGAVIGRAAAYFNRGVRKTGQRTVGAPYVPKKSQRRDRGSAVVSLMVESAIDECTDSTPGIFERWSRKKAS